MRVATDRQDCGGIDLAREWGAKEGRRGTKPLAALQAQGAFQGSASDTSGLPV